MRKKTTSPTGVGKFAITLATLILSALACPAQKGQIFVGNALTGVVGKYSPSGAPLNTYLISGLTDVEGIAVDGDGYLYVTTIDSIGKYTVSGRPIQKTLISGLCSAWAVVLDGKGHLFVANYCGSIGEYTTAGATVNAALIPNLPQLTGLAIQDTNLFVSIYGTPPDWVGSIGQFTTSGATINSELVPNLQWSWGMLINPQGHLLVANNTLGTVTEYDGTNIVHQSHTGLVLTGMAFDADGNILVATDSLNAIAKLSPSGEVVNDAFIPDLGEPRGVAVALPPSAAAVQEGNQTVSAGSSVSLSVACSGTPPFKYQWFHGNHRIKNTKSTLMLDHVKPRDAGKYTVHVRNFFGRTVSSAVKLSVTSTK